MANYAAIKTCCIENGPGIRTSIFFSGCRRYCPGCHNSDIWDFGYGTPFNKETIDYILKTLEPEWVDGLSILGGEPFEIENRDAVMELMEAVRDRFAYSKTIWLYTGYLYEELDLLLSDFIDLYVDVLVDGPYLEAERDVNLAYRGSRNQRLIDIVKSLQSKKVILWQENA